MKVIHSLVALTLLTGVAYASVPVKQQLELKGQEANALVKQSNHIYINAPSNMPSFVEFSEGVSSEKAMSGLKSAFNFRNNDELRFVKEEKDNIGFIHVISELTTI